MLKNKRLYFITLFSLSSFCFGLALASQTMTRPTMKAQPKPISDFLKLDKDLLEGKQVDLAFLMTSSYIMLSSPYSSNMSKDQEIYSLNGSSTRVELGDISQSRGTMFKYSLPMAVVSKVVLHCKDGFIVESYEEKKNLKYASRQKSLHGVGGSSFSIEFDFNGYLLGIYNTGIEIGTITFKEVASNAKFSVPLVLGLGSTKPSWGQELASAELSDYIGDDTNYWYTLMAGIKKVITAGVYSNIFKSLVVDSSADGEAKLVLSAKLANYRGSNANMFVPSAYALSLGLTDSLLSGVYELDGKDQEKSDYPLSLPTGTLPKEVLGILQQSTVSQIDNSFYVVITR